MKRASLHVIPAPVAFGRPKTLRLDDFADQVAAGAFRGLPVTVKRNGFAIVCENWGDGTGARYFTKRGFGVTGTDECGGGALGKTLRMIGAHLERMDMFDPRRVSFDPDGIASRPEEDLGDARECTRVHVEFCVRPRAGPHAGMDDLCALMHGKWAADPSAYKVEAVAFDIELDDEDDNLPFWDRHAMMSGAFPPENVVQVLTGADEIVHALATAEGVVAYNERSEAWKVKAPHPLPMKIVAVRRTVKGFMGYDTMLVGVPEGPSERQYRVLCEIDMTEMFTTGPGRRGKCFLDASLFEPHKKTGKTAYKGPSRVAQMVCKLTDAVLRAHRATRATVVGPTRAVADDLTLRVDDGRSFGFAAGDEFLNPPVDVVMSPNEVWRLKAGALHLQATSVLAVGAFGGAEYRWLLGRPFTLADVERVADERLCQKPQELYRFVRVGDQFGPLRDALKGRQ